jgi:hypothetical protein
MFFLTFSTVKESCIELINMVLVTDHFQQVLSLANHYQRTSFVPATEI